jgi:DNA invertase Pin-like site-specific DNA recombinase
MAECKEGCGRVARSRGMCSSHYRRWPAGLLAGLAELELELGRERRAASREARRARGQHIGRPKALDEKKAALAQRMHANGESASTIANALGVSRATVYRVLAQSTE